MLTKDNKTWQALLLFLKLISLPATNNGPIVQNNTSFNQNCHLHNNFSICGICRGQCHYVFNTVLCNSCIVFCAKPKEVDPIKPISL